MQQGYPLYYGLEYAAQFSGLFGRFAIGQQPTPLANHYLMLRLDFSRINTQTQQSTLAGFIRNVRQGSSHFLAVYHNYFSQEAPPHPPPAD